MTYSVKTIYPEFKCLTTFKKVMKSLGRVNREERYNGFTGMAVGWWGDSVFNNMNSKNIDYNGNRERKLVFIWSGIPIKLDKSLDVCFLKMNKDTRYMNRFNTMNYYDGVGEKHTKML
jgi:hypothetical protein